MKKTIRRYKATFGFLETYEGETIEEKVRRVVENKEPISDGAPIVYTEKKDGVLPQFNIRTDKWEIALDAMDKVQASRIAKSKQYMETLEKKGEEMENSGEDPKSN